MNMMPLLSVQVELDYELLLVLQKQVSTPLASPNFSLQEVTLSQLKVESMLH